MSSSRLSDLLNGLVGAGATPGASIALSVDGQRFAASSGVSNMVSGSPLGPDSRFQIGCITKLLTSVVSLELAAAGRLDLDEPIGRHLPELGQLDIGNEISPRHLLSHTSGYRGVNIVDPVVRFYFDWHKFLQLLRNGRRRFAPGTVFDYEHTECVLLGRIVERLTGERIQDLYDEMIWKPLGIRCGRIRKDAGEPEAHVADHSFDAAARQYLPLRSVPHCEFWEASLSDLTMNLADLVTLGEAVAGFSRNAVFSSSTIQMLREPQVSLPLCAGAELQEQMPVAFGFGCAQYGTTVFGHNGSARGQTCALRFDLASRTVLAVGLNCWRPDARDLLCRRLLTTLSRGPENASTLPHPGWSFDGLSGRYLGSHGIWVDVAATPGQLALDLFNSAVPTPTSVLLRRLENGVVDVQSPASHLTAGFFDVAGTGRTALMLGLNAYCKDDE